MKKTTKTYVVPLVDDATLDRLAFDAMLAAGGDVNLATDIMWLYDAIRFEDKDGSEVVIIDHEEEAE
jgi:hypothetical protein